MRNWKAMTAPGGPRSVVPSICKSVPQSHANYSDQQCLLLHQRSVLSLHACTLAGCDVHAFACQPLVPGSQHSWHVWPQQQATTMGCLAVAFISTHACLHTIAQLPAVLPRQYNGHPAAVPRELMHHLVSTSTTLAAGSAGRLRRLPTYLLSQLSRAGQLIRRRLGAVTGSNTTACSSTPARTRVAREVTKSSLLHTSKCLCGL
jgi:hypothetical protein